VKFIIPKANKARFHSICSSSSLLQPCGHVTELLLEPGLDKTSKDIGDGVCLKLVDKFCYLGDMVNVDGDDDSAKEDRVC